MKIKLFLLSIPLLAVLTCFAQQKQTKIKFTPSALFGINTTTADVAYGGEANLSKGILKNSDLTFSVGLNHFSGNSAYRVVSANSITDYKNRNVRNLIPIKLGMRIGAGKFYLSGEAGAAFGNKGDNEAVRATYSTSSSAVTTYFTEPKTSIRCFAYSPAIGIFIKALNIGLKYEGYSSTYMPDQLALKLGYMIKL